MSEISNADSCFKIFHETTVIHAFIPSQPYTVLVDTSSGIVKGLPFLHIQH